MKIAITGGIGSGKSAVAAVIRRSGYKVVSADEAYRRISGRADYLSAVKKLFPDAVKGEPPALDRAVLAAEVFADGKKRAALNELAHPLIMKEMFEEAKGGTRRLFRGAPALRGRVRRSVRQGDRRHAR